MSASKDGTPRRNSIGSTLLHTIPAPARARIVYSGALKTCDVRIFERVGSRVWCGEKDGGIAIRSIDNGQLERRLPAPRGCQDIILCCTHVSKKVWIGCSSGVIRLYGSESFNLNKICTKHKAGVTAIVEWNGRVFTSSMDSSIVVWSTEGELITSWIAHSLGVRVLLATAAGVFSGGEDNSLRLWTENGVCKGAYLGHKSSVSSVAFASPYVWSGCEAGVIFVWDVQSSKKVKLIEHHKGRINKLITASDCVWSASNDKTICIWDAKNLTLSKQLSIKDGLAGTPSWLQQISHKEVLNVWACVQGKLTIWSLETPIREPSNGEQQLVPCNAPSFREALSELQFQQIRTLQAENERLHSELANLQQGQPSTENVNNAELLLEIEELRTRLRIGSSSPTMENIDLKLEYEERLRESATRIDFLQRAHVQATEALKSLQEQLHSQRNHHKEAMRAASENSSGMQRALYTQIREQQLTIQQNQINSERKIKELHESYYHKIEDLRTLQKDVRQTHSATQVSADSTCKACQTLENFHFESSIAVQADMSPRPDEELICTIRELEEEIRILKHTARQAQQAQLSARSSSRGSYTRHDVWDESTYFGDGASDCLQTPRPVTPPEKTNVLTTPQIGSNDASIQHILRDLSKKFSEVLEEKETLKKEQTEVAQRKRESPGETRTSGSVTPRVATQRNSSFSPSFATEPLRATAKVKRVKQRTSVTKRSKLGVDDSSASEKDREQASGREQDLTHPARRSAGPPIKANGARTQFEAVSTPIALQRTEEAIRKRAEEVLQQTREDMWHRMEQTREDMWQRMVTRESDLLYRLQEAERRSASASQRDSLGSNGDFFSKREKMATSDSESRTSLLVDEKKEDHMSFNGDLAEGSGVTSPHHDENDSDLSQNVATPQRRNPNGVIPRDRHRSLPVHPTPLFAKSDARRASALPSATFHTAPKSAPRDRLNDTFRSAGSFVSPLPSPTSIIGSATPPVSTKTIRDAIKEDLAYIDEMITQQKLLYTTAASPANCNASPTGRRSA